MGTGGALAARSRVVGKNINYKAVLIYTSLRRTYKRVVVFHDSLQREFFGLANGRELLLFCWANQTERLRKEREEGATIVIVIETRKLNIEIFWNFYIVIRSLCVRFTFL